jgi:hypothetical protein
MTTATSDGWGRLIWVLRGKSTHLMLHSDLLQEGDLLQFLPEGEEDHVETRVRRRVTDGYRVEYLVTTLKDEREYVLREHSVCCRLAPDR